MKTVLLVAALLVCVGVPTSADTIGKTTVDPNAPRAGAMSEPAEPVADIETRLARKITYEARGKSVLAVLTELSKLTGVSLKAGYNDQDWQVRDRKMNVFARDIPLAQLMNSIARVMMFRWKAGEDEPRVYRLFMDRKTLLDAEARRMREEMRLEQLQAEQRGKLLADFARLENLSPEELTKLREDAPLLYMLAKTGIGPAFGRLFGAVPAIHEALATGQSLSMSVGDIEPEAHQYLLDGVRGTLELASAISGEQVPFPQELIENISAMTVRINRMKAEAAGDPMGRLLAGDISLSYNDCNMSFGLPDPSGKLANAIGKYLVDAMESDRKIGTSINQDATPEILEALKSELQQTESGEPRIEHTDDPALRAKVRMEVKSRRLDDVLAALASCSSFGVVSDSFGPADGITTISGEMEIRNVLDKVAEGYEYNWDRHGSVLEFRDRHWYSKRAAQIPEAWLEQWRNMLKRTGTLDLGDLARIAALTQEQFNLNVVPDSVLAAAGISGPIFANRDLLRLYGVLDQAQRAALFADAGLDLCRLGPSQWPLAEQLIARRSGMSLSSSESSVVLVGTRKQKDGKQVDYSFKVVADRIPAMVWRLSTPIYKEPKKEQPGEKPTGGHDSPKSGD